jgi:ribose 5-phosphate isomerase A
MTKLNQEEQKTLVGTEVADHPLINNDIENPLVIGIGTGSTVLPFIEALGKRVNGNEKLKIIAVVTSDDSEEKCEDRGIKVKSVDSVRKIHIAVDGADEVDPDFNLIKGGGGAHVREKKVDYKAEHFVVIVDESKDVKCLGKFKLPIEVKKNKLVQALAEFSQPWFGGVNPEVRMKEKEDKKDEEEDEKEMYVTDNGNYIIDAQYVGIANPARIEEKIQTRVPGVVKDGVGIFTGDHVNEVWIGKADGTIDIKENKKK